MNMQIGLVGLPQSGKTTFFNILSGSSAPTGFTSAGEVHYGSAAVPDSRIDFLSRLYRPRKTVYARIDFEDIPGAHLDGNAAHAARLLDEARSADALVQVIPVFGGEESENRGSGMSSPYREMLDFYSELLLADLDAVEKRLERLRNAPKAKNNAAAQIDLLERLREALEQERPAAAVLTGDAERQLLAGQVFLTEKPLIAALNLDEGRLGDGDYPERGRVREYTAARGIPVIEICARVEAEIEELPPADRAAFLAEMGLEESGLGRLARTAYERLGLISFFTVGEDEVRAWTIRRGATARQAAGKIHSDIERGFIRAEIFHYDDIARLGSAAGVREAGLFRLEGKDYPVRDGDIINFRFNV